MGRPARDGELLRLAAVARQGARGAGAADRKGQGRPAPGQEPIQARPQDRRLSGAHPGDRRTGRRVQPHRHCSRSRRCAGRGSAFQRRRAGGMGARPADQCARDRDRRRFRRGRQAHRRSGNGRGDRGIRPADRGYFTPSGAKDPSVAEGPRMRLAQSRQRDGRRRARARRAPRRRAAGAGDPADHRRDQPEEARRHARLRRRRRPGPWSSAVSRRRHRAMVRAIDPAAELSAADARGGRRPRGTGGRGQDWRPRAATLLGQADRRAGLRIAPCADRG